MSINIDNVINTLTDNISLLQLQKKTIQNNTNYNNNLNHENNLDLEINELECKIKNLELHKFNMNKIDTWDLQNKKYLKNTFQFKYLPLEIPNLYCNKYFDDEDFIYIYLKIPTIVLNSMTQLNLVYYTYLDELNYFNNTINTIQPENYNFENYNILIDIIKIYINVLNFNVELSNCHNIGTIDLDKIFNTSCLIGKLEYIFNEMMDKICFDYTDNEYKSMEQIYKELTYGIKLIMSNINIIINYYKYLNIDSINLFENNHKERFIRLLNNFCVIMIFLKFILVDLGETYTLDEFVKYNIDTDSADIEDN